LEEYKNLMQRNEVPFQNNPLAMASLEQKIGKVTSGLAIQSFQDSIKNDPDFWKLPAEQQDARMLEFMNKQVGELTELYGYTDNYWFRKGFFENTLPKRLETILQAKEYRENQLKQQDYIASMANVTAMINSPNVTGKEIADYVKQDFTISGQYKNPQEQMQAVEAVMKQLAGSRYGYEKLEQMGEETVPNTNIKYKDFIGIDKYEAYKIQSQNLANQSRREELTAIEVNANDIAERGDSSMLYNAMMDTFEKTKGAETEEVKIYKNAYKKSITVQKRMRDEAYKQQQAEEMKAAKDQLVRNFASRGSEMSMADLSRLKTVFGVSDSEFKQIYNEQLIKGYISPDTHDRLALNRSIPEGSNPALQVNKSMVNGAVSSLDRLTNGMFYKTDVPPQDIPQEIGEAVALFNRIGYSDFSAATGCTPAELADIQAVARAQAEGRSYADVVKNKVADKIKMEQDKTYDRKRTIDLIKMTQEGTFTGVEYPLDGRAMTGIVENAVGLMKSEGLDAKKAGEKATEQFWLNNVSFLGATVPKTVFGSSKDFPEGFTKYLGNYIKSDLEGRKLEGLQGYFNPKSNTFTVADANTLEIVKSYTMDDMKKIVSEEHSINLMQGLVDKYGLTEQVKKDIETKGFELDADKKVKLKGKARKLFKEQSKDIGSVLNDTDLDVFKGTGD
jgi:hypothetical protein